MIAQRGADKILHLLGISIRNQGSGDAPPHPGKALAQPGEVAGQRGLEFQDFA